MSRQLEAKLAETVPAPDPPMMAVSWPVKDIDLCVFPRERGGILAKRAPECNSPEIDLRRTLPLDRLRVSFTPIFDNEMFIVLT